jgi:hypothetical protein
MKKIILGSFILISICLRAQVSAFTFNINGTPPAGLAQALTIAGQRWSNYLQITVPIKVNVYTINSNLYPFSAITLANGRENFVNAPFPNLLYTTALANQLAGVELNQGEYDMDIYFNLYSAFYYGTGKPSSMNLDFISTAMHEIGHGLGFYSDGYVDGTGKGSFGNIPPSAIAPLAPSFPWRGQDSVPTIYDKYIVKASNNNLISMAPENSVALGDSIKNGAVYFSGPIYANASHSNAPIRLSGGTGTYTLGADLLHIHNSYANTIMSYYWGDGDTVRTPAPWEIGILREIGWNFKTVGIDENYNYSVTTAYPNPADANIFISAKDITGFNIYNLQGQSILTNINLRKQDDLMIDTQNLSEGVYFLKLQFTGGDRTVMKKIVIKHF